jgi:hypothetical protein
MVYRTPKVYAKARGGAPTSERIRAPARARQCLCHSAHRKGYDTHKHVKGQKRHLLVNALGMPLSKRL